MTWLLILRPLNLFQAVLAVWLAAFVINGLADLRTLTLLLFSVICINGAGNVVNDIYDMEIDRVNRPNRPLPSGKMSIAQARIYMISLFMAGIVASAFINLQTFFITTFIATPLLVGYSVWFKRMPLIGNLVVAIMLAMTFAYVGVAYGNFPAMVPLIGLAFGFTIIREIVKDLEDQAGDLSQGARTLPIVWGESATLVFISFLTGLFIIADLLPYGLHVYNSAYLLFVIVGVNFPLLSALIFMWFKPGKTMFRRVQLMLKYDIFVGLLAILLGSR